jgi:hypothetical protein
MNKQFPFYVIVLVILTGLAITLAQQATHRGEALASVVMLFIAVIFWKKVQKLSR